MLPPPHSIAAQLHRDQWPPTLSAHLRDAVSGAEVAWLVGLIEALGTAPARAVPHAQRMVLRALALVPGCVSSLAAVLPVVDLTPQGRHPDEHARDLAGRLAATQPPSALVDALSRAGVDPWADILPLWVQESVARGHDLRAYPEVVAYWRESAHPLASMPLHPLPIEAVPPIRPGRYFPTGAGSWGGGPVWGVRWDELPAVPAAPRATRRRLSRAQRAELSAAFASAAMHNGEVEVAVFSLDPPVSTLSRPVMASLPLSCFNNRHPEEGHRLRPVPAPDGLRTQAMTPDEAYAMLLCAASLGGCTNQTWSGAWGRRDAWRTLAAMTGSQGSLETIEAAARACQWATFRSPSAWFFHITADETAVCLRPDGQTLAVFAATDSD